MGHTWLLVVAKRKRSRVSVAVRLLDLGGLPETLGWAGPSLSPAPHRCSAGWLASDTCAGGARASDPRAAMHQAG